MLSFHPLTTKELIKVGIAFETLEAAERFTAHIQEELEVRVGAKISEGKTETQLDEFDRCQTTEESTQWLKKNCPAYKKIVVHMCKQMEEELVKFRDMIPGCVSFPADKAKETPLCCLELGKGSSGALKRAGFDTVEQVLAADLRRIRNLTHACREEIWEQLWEHYYFGRFSPVDPREDADQVSQSADAHGKDGGEGAPAPLYGPRLLHASVIHPSWGRGKVIEVDGKKPYKYVILQFPKEGRKKLGYPWFAKRCRLVS